MATANNIDSLNGMFKEVYADKIENLIPDGVKFYNQVEFNKESKRNGNLYHQPVVLGLEHGVTYGGSNGDAFALNASIAGTMKDAQVQGYEMVLRSTLSVAAASRTLNGEASFEKSTKHLVANMLRSMSRRLEVQLLYGKRGIGTTNAATSGDQIIHISDGSWAPGIWSGAENMEIDVYQSDLSTLRVAGLKINSVDFDARDIVVASGADGVVGSGDVIFYKGANSNEFDGVENIIRNTGTLFNINASSFNLWKGRVLDNSGTPRDISFELITNAVTKLVEKGLTDKKVSVWINPMQFDVLLADLAAKRTFDQSYDTKEGKDGQKVISFYSQNGEIEIVPSIYMKAGHSFILCMDEFERIGSSDITFNMPGFGEDEFFRLLNDANGYELRAYTDQALFCAAPGLQAILDDLSVVA